MHSSPRNLLSARRAALTLPEVLITCGIIAILTTLIAVQWDIYRKKTNQAVCMGNLRQLGSAFFLYAGEHNGYFPEWIRPEIDDPLSDNPTGTGLQWDMQIFNYLYPEGFSAYKNTDRSTVFWCPSSKRVLPGKKGRSLSYKYNREVARNNANSRNSTTLENRQRLVLLADSSISSEDKERSNGMGGSTNNTLFLVWYSTQVHFAYDWHQGMVNILFADGHVASRRPVGNPEDPNFATDYRLRLPRGVIFYNGQLPTPE